MDSEIEQRLYETIEDIESENTMLREVKDELMEENEKLREKNKELCKLVKEMEVN